MGTNGKYDILEREGASDRVVPESTPLYLFGEGCDPRKGIRRG